jgi:uncharacterized protein
VNLARRYPVASYLFAAVTISYVLGIGAYLLFKNVQALLGTNVPHVNDLGLKFGPSLAGLLITWLIAGGEGVRRLLGRLVKWRGSATLYVCAVVVPPVTIVAALLLRGHATELSAVNPASALGVFVAQLAINTFLGGGLSEELGWRGFMTPHLSRRRTPLVASLIVAVAWFAWHIPAYLLTSKAEVDPILPFAAIAFPLSVFLTWLYFRSGESLLFPVLFHASINASTYAMLILVPQVAASPGFQPANDWVLAGIWLGLAGIVVAGFGARLGRTASTVRIDAREAKA